MSIESMKLALEALEYHTQQTRPIQKTNEAIEELRQAIEHYSRVQTQMDDIIKTLRCPNCDSLERQNAELDLRLAEQDQPPFGYLTNKRQRVSFEPNATGLSNMPMTIDWKIPVYGSPQPQRQPLTDWIDPNNKTQERFLPNIGEPVLFCHRGKTYYGQHNGGSFQFGYGVTKKYFNTWECRWMDMPAAHGIKGEA